MKTAWRKSQLVYCAFKRILDIIFSLLGMPLLILAIIFIGPFIKLQDHGPIFFRQTRTGKKGKNFTLYKFRSMPIENDVLDFKKEDQMTRVGKFIRKTSIDELPQFWNVLKGEMSFVGPRPWIPEYYQNMNKKQRCRFLVRPGITGLAQVKGRNNISVIEKINFDLEYVSKLSLWEDIKIILLTIKTIFEKESSYSKKVVIKDELITLKGYKDGKD